MKKHWILLLLVTCLVIGSTFARNRTDRTRTQVKRPPSPRRCLEKVELTERQKLAISSIRQNAMAALREVETREEAKAIIEQMHADTLAILTDEQFAIYKECMNPEKPATCMDKVGLTPEQIEEMDTIRHAARVALKEAQTAEEACAIIERMHQAIEDVLTEEQLAALRECLRPKEPVNCMDRIDLTDRQIAIMDEIRAASMELLETAETREEIRAVMDMMREDLMEVLNEEQVAALEKCRDAQRDRKQMER